MVALHNESLLEQMERKGYTENLRLSEITPSQYQTFVISKTIITYLNHAVVLSRMERQDDGKKYLDMAEKLAIKYPEIAASEAGIMQRITLFKKNVLPKPKYKEDSEKVYRKYKNEIETLLNKCLRKEPYDIALLQRIVHLIEEMTRMPEHEIYKNIYTVAKYYHLLNMLFLSIDRQDQAFEMLQRSADLADSDDHKEELYANIFSDMCAYAKSFESKLQYSKKALAIYDDLQKNEKDYSQNSYAMILYNTSIISMKYNEYRTALEYAKKASFIWEKLLLSDPDEQIKEYLPEVQRLIAFLEQKIKQGS